MGKKIDKLRISWIDYIKGICMIAVIISHLQWSMWCARFLAPFFLTGFFFASGYVFSRKDCFRSFLRSKIRGLLVPIIAFGFINTLLTTFVEETPVIERIIGIILQQPGCWDDLWFVACLFTMELIFYAITSVTKTIKTTGLLVVLCMCIGYSMMRFISISLPWHLVNACILIGFFYFGYMARKAVFCQKVIDRMRNLKVLALFIVMYVMIICSYKNFPIDIHLLNYGCFSMFMLSAFVGVMLLISVTLILERFDNNVCMRFVRYIGRNTLVYYAFQSKMIRLVLIVLSMVGISKCGDLVITICALIVCMLMVIPSYIINKYVPYLIGK